MPDDPRTTLSEDAGQPVAGVALDYQPRREPVPAIELDHVARTTSPLLVHLGLTLTAVAAGPLEGFFSGTLLGAILLAVTVVAGSTAAMLWPIAVLLAIAAIIDYATLFRVSAVRFCLIVAITEVILSAGVVLLFLRGC